jgi:hypothetical protein
VGRGNITWSAKTIRGTFVVGPRRGLFRWRRLNPRGLNSLGLALKILRVLSYPGGDKADSLTVMSYTAAQTLVQVLEQCGDDLTRDNVLRQAANLHELRLGMLLPGITINTGPTDYAPLKQMQMMRFTGEHWKLFGPIMKGALTGS